MSVIERIRQIQEEQAQKAAEAEAARVAAIQKAERERLALEEQKRKSEEEVRQKEIDRQNFVKTRAAIAFSESGVLEAFVEINKQILKNRGKHGIVYDLEHGSVDLRFDTLDIHGSEYSHISAVFNPDSEILTIAGLESKNLNKIQLKDKALVESFVAEAFLAPARYKYVPYQPPSDNDGGRPFHGEAGAGGWGVN